MRQLLSYLFSGAARRVYWRLKLINSLKAKNRPRIAGLVCREMERKFGVFISSQADVPTSTRFPHPVGIVVGKGVRLGEGVIIYQNVTLGGRRLKDGRLNRYPRIGSNVTIFAGAVIVGDITVGDRSVIGANAVVLKDVPADSVVTGVPGIARPSRPTDVPQTELTNSSTRGHRRD